MAVSPHVISAVRRFLCYPKFDFMKRFFQKFRIFLLAFALGIGTTWFYLQFSQFTLANASLTDISLLWRVQKSFVVFNLPTTTLTDSVKIFAAEIGSTVDDGKFVRLRVENMSREAVYFSGYGIESPCSYIIKSAAQEEKSNCDCGTGLERQILLTGESTVFTVKPLFNAEKVKVGFYFRVKSNEPAQIYWSEEITLDK